MRLLQFCAESGLQSRSRLWNEVDMVVSSPVENGG